jgi:hypothetical protein
MELVRGYQDYDLFLRVLIVWPIRVRLSVIQSKVDSGDRRLFLNNLFKHTRSLEKASTAIRVRFLFYSHMLSSQTSQPPARFLATLQCRGHRCVRGLKEAETW